MAIDPRIALAGQQPNFLNTINSANQAAAFQNESVATNQLRNFLRENGDQVYAGNEQALGQYAQFSPEQALGVRNTRDQMSERQERLKMARAAAARAAAGQAASMDARAAAAQAEALERAVSGAMMAQTPEQWDAFVSQRAPDLVGQFENRDMIAAEYMGVVDAFKMANPEPQGPMSSLGKIQADINAGILPQDTPLRAEQVNEIVFGPDGNPILQRGGIPDAPKLTVDAAKNAGFYNRTLASNEILDQFDTEGSSLRGRALENAPLGLGNYAQSPEYQQFEQARRDFVNAILRRESGAVISEEEFANAERQYFPAPGDSPQVVEQKRNNRKTAIEGLRLGAGEGASYVDTILSPGGGQGSQSGANQAIDALESDLSAKYPEFFR